MHFLYSRFYNYRLVYDYSHNNLHYIHIRLGTDQYIYFEYMLIKGYSPNQLNIPVYSLDMDLQNNLVSMYTIRHSLVLCTRHLHHKVKVHMGLDIQPLMELKDGFKIMNSLTDKYFCHR